MKFDSHRHINVLGLILGAIHLVVVLWMAVQPNDGSFQYVLIALPDFPVTLLDYGFGSLLNIDLGWASFVVLGTLWWYFIGFWIMKLIGQRQSSID